TACRTRFSSRRSRNLEEIGTVTRRLHHLGNSIQHDTGCSAMGNPSGIAAIAATRGSPAGIPIYQHSAALSKVELQQRAAKFSIPERNAGPLLSFHVVAVHTTSINPRS